MLGDWNRLRAVKIVARVPSLLGADEARQVSAVVQAKSGGQPIVIQINVWIVDVATVDVVRRIARGIGYPAKIRVHLGLEIANPR